MIRVKNIWKKKLMVCTAIAILVSIGVMFLGCIEKEESTPTPTSVAKLVLRNAENSREF